MTPACGRCLSIKGTADLGLDVRQTFRFAVPTKQHHLKGSLEVSHLKHTEQRTSWAFLINVALKLLCFIPKLCFAFCNKWTVLNFPLLQVVWNRINDVPNIHVDMFLFLASASFVCPTGHFARISIVSKLFCLWLLTFRLEMPLWINIKLFYTWSMYQSMPPLSEA